MIGTGPKTDLALIKVDRLPIFPLSNSPTAYRAWATNLDWDRNRARPAVGEGFPFLLFRLQDGFTVSPWLTVPEAPL